MTDAAKIPHSNDHSADKDDQRGSTGKERAAFQLPADLDASSIPAEEWVLFSAEESIIEAAAASEWPCVRVDLLAFRESPYEPSSLEGSLADLVDGRRCALLANPRGDVSDEHWIAWRQVAELLHQSGAADVRLSAPPLPDPVLEGDSPHENGDSRPPSSKSPGEGNHIRDETVAVIAELLGTDDPDSEETVPDWLNELPRHPSDDALIKRVREELEASPEWPERTPWYRRAIDTIAAADLDEATKEGLARQIKTAAKLSLRQVRNDLRHYRGRILTPRLPDSSPSSWLRDLSDDALWSACATLAQQPDLLAAYAETLEELGLAGASRHAKLLVLAFTSRLVERPVNVYIRGESSTGKSHLMKTVAQLFPEDALISMTGMSERALVYDQRSYRHRFLLVSESTALQQGSGKGASVMATLIREVTSSHQVRYSTTRMDEQGKRDAQTIVKEGPTGLCTTGTRALEQELGTRVLFLDMTPDASYRSDVLGHLARQANRSQHDRPDPTPFLALQAWLQRTCAGRCDVYIPFAEAISPQFNRDANRSLRDFPTLLSLIKTHALLHQATRERDEQGRIIATLEDYRQVYELSEPAFRASVLPNWTRAEREIIDAIDELSGDSDDEGVTVAQLAEALGISANAVNTRLEGLKREGDVVNLAANGQVGRYVLGEPARRSMSALPHPDEVADAFAARSHGDTGSSGSPNPEATKRMPESNGAGEERSANPPSPAPDEASHAVIAKSSSHEAAEADSPEQGSMDSLFS